MFQLALGTSTSSTTILKKLAMVDGARIASLQKKGIAKNFQVPYRVLYRFQT